MERQPTYMLVVFPWKNNCEDNLVCLSDTTLKFRYWTNSDFSWNSTVAEDAVVMEIEKNKL